jgi:hypothetical protein
MCALLSSWWTRLTAAMATPRTPRRRRTQFDDWPRHEHPRHSEPLARHAPRGRPAWPWPCGLQYQLQCSRVSLPRSAKIRAPSAHHSREARTIRSLHAVPHARQPGAWALYAAGTQTRRSRSIHLHIHRHRLQPRVCLPWHCLAHYQARATCLCCCRPRQRSRLSVGNHDWHALANTDAG